MANIIGTNGNDTLVGSDSGDTINGKAGNDTITITASYGNDTFRNDTLTGGGGKDKFVYGLNYKTNTDIITDFGGIGKGVNPSAAVIAEVDTLEFQAAGLTPQNLLLTQNGNNLKITFEGLLDYTGADYSPKVILQNFALENLDNLSLSTGATVDLGNILFNGQTSITDSFDVFNANSTQSTIFNKNTVTFLNDLNNNVNGFDNSDDVVNGQGGNDIIDGKSGNDLLRGGAGNDTLIGGAGNDTLDGGTRNDFLNVDTGNDSLVGGTGKDYLNVENSTGNNTLNGGADDDTLDAGASKGNNLLSGGDGNDSLSASYISIYGGHMVFPSSGNNTLNGGAGNDTLSARSSQKSNNLLSGGDGNDFLDVSGVNTYRGDPSFSSLGNNTLNGGAGDDSLRADISSGNNLLSGGDGNDTLSTSSGIGNYADYIPPSSGNNTLNGGAGDDYLDATISTGNNLLSGGDGNDTLSTFSSIVMYNYYSSGNNTLNGGLGDDTLIATISSGNNLLSGGDGNDSFYLSPTGFASSYLVTQTVDGGKGDDVLSVDYSNAAGGITTTFNATTNIGEITAGTNRVSYKNIEGLNILGTAYDDNIVGNSGNDTLSGGYGKDTIDGGKGDDVLSVDYSNAAGGITTTFNATTNIGEITAGTNRVSYKNIEGLNILGSSYYNDNIVGNSGNDTLSGGYGGKDTIDGGKGDDVLSVHNGYGYPGTGAITGGAGDDTLSASTSTGNNLLSGDDGNDYLDISGEYSSYDYSDSRSSGNNTLKGGAGDDTLSANGSTGDNLLSGGDGNDYIFASSATGNNTFDGGNGNDILTGGLGNDILIGGLGNDTLYGGTGTDTFVFKSYNEGIDRLYDFKATNELIQVSAAGFGGGLSIGSLQTSQFTLGTSATTSNQRFIYDNITGGLYFDQDGSGGAFTQVKFAQLSAGVTLTKNNFVVV